MMTLLIMLGLGSIYIKNISARAKQTEKEIDPFCDLQYDYVFIGDSITFRNDWGYFYPDKLLVNSGIDGNKTEQVLERLEKDVYFYHPQKVILLIGINDLRDGIDPNVIASNMEQIILEMKDNLPNTKIYLESIYPINDNISTSYVKKDATNSNILKLNEYYKEIATKNEVTYIDVYSQLLDEKGELNPIYTKDGLHLSLQGYIAVTKELNEYIIK